METVTIDRAELHEVYMQARELSEGRGQHKLAVEVLVNFIFEELGEPGAGE